MTRLLSIASLSIYGEANTALHRHKALCEIFNNQVDTVDTYFRFTFLNRVINKAFKYGVNFPFVGVYELNQKIIKKVKQKHYDVVWIDKGIAIKSETLKFIKLYSPNTIIIGYSPDEMTQRHNQSADFLASLPFYDAYITTKSYAINDLKKLGAKRVYFVNNAFEPSFHFPRNISNKDKVNLGGEIGFVGMWEADRASVILYLAEKGLDIRVWGAGKWLQYKNKFPNLRIEDKGLFSEEYSRALGAFKINLCFLRKMNFDQQTTRSIEIPASGGFMLAERTSEHQNLFEEGVEAEFFCSNEELYQKCIFYLNNDVTREGIRLAGYNKCLIAGYSNKETLQKILNVILSDFND